MTAAFAELIARRQSALAAQDAAQACWPSRQGDAYQAAMRPVVREMTALAQALDVGGASGLERSRGWRCVGDAWFEIARGVDLPALCEAEAAYVRAEAAMAGMDAPLDRAKLDFNFANIVRGLSGGQDRDRLEEADLRYQLALAGFRAVAPQRVAQVRTALGSLQSQLALLDVQESLSRGGAGLRRLGEAVAAHPDDTGLQAQARARLSALHAQADAALGQAQGALQLAARHLPAELAGRLADMVAQLQRADGSADDPGQRLLPLLLARFAEDLAHGHVSPERAAALEPLLDKLQQVVNTPAQTLEALTDRSSRLLDLMRHLLQVLGQPGPGSPPQAGSRAEFIAQACRVLGRHLAEQQIQPLLAHGEREQCLALFAQLAEAHQSESARAADDARVIACEHDRLRPLAQEIARLDLRHHLMLAEPFWPTPKTEPDASGVYVWGTGPLVAVLDALSDRLRLRRLRPAAGADPGAAAWQAIGACRVALFDLRALDAAGLAAACYEIGLAHCLGRRLCMVAGAEQQLPFDIEVQPLRLAAADDASARLAEAIDAALYTPLAREDGSTLAATVAELHRRLGGPDAPFAVRKALQWVDDAADDPMLAWQRIESALGFAAARAPVLITPTWPGRYPDVLAAPRLFHVMPFGRDWSASAHDAAASACRRTGATYVRGDEVPDARVIRSIWDEIGRASHVLVDLTGLNANVALELGLAHGLGRACLVVAQGDPVQWLFPAIRRLRVAAYCTDEGSRTLEMVVAGFLRPPN